MEYYLPKFKAFLFGLLSKRDLFTGEFDYIVPIESKGAMLLNNVLYDDVSDLGKKVLYSRAFDYLPPSDLPNKSVLLLDDIAISGKTLEFYRQILQKKGVEKITKSAFLKHPEFDKNSGEVKNGLKDIRFGFPIDADEYHVFSMEIPNFYIKERPSYPDHFKLTIIFDRPIEPEALDDFGTLIRYDRSNVQNEWSIHLPAISLNGKTGSIKRYDSAFKVRMSNNARFPLKWKISPVIFPSLTREPSVEDLDPLEKTLYGALNRDWHDESVRKTDLYESITLGDRIKTVSGFLNYLETQKIATRELEFGARNLEKYYGYEATAKVEKIAKDCLTERKNIGVSFNKPASDFDMYRIPKMRVPIIALLDHIYENHPDNVDKPPWKKRPVGLTIKEIASELGESASTTSVACESVNDYGFVVPMTENFSRKYRDSEIGKEHLKHESR